MASIILYIVNCLLYLYKITDFLYSSKQNYKRRKFKTHIKKRGNNERALG